MYLSIRELFERSRIYKGYLQYFNDWKDAVKTDPALFANPYVFIDDVVKDIIDYTTSDIAQDYWLLILGYPGTGKSSLSIILYKKIMENLGYTDEEIREWSYKDILYLIHEYPKRVMYHRIYIKKYNNLSPKKIAHPIVLDEAHNIFDIYVDKTKDVVELLRDVYEIREWRLIHIVNTQYPNQLAKRVQQRFKSIIYLWNDVIEKGDPLWGLYEKQYERLYNKKPDTNKGFIGWAAQYKQYKAHLLMEYLSKTYTIDQPGVVLRKIVPDAIFPHFFILHESGDLYQIYKKIKDFGYSTKILMREAFEIRDSVRSTFMKILYKILEKYPSIIADDHGNLTEEIKIYVNKQSKLIGIENIGDVDIKQRKDGTFIITIRRIDELLLSYIKEYYDVLAKRSPIQNIGDEIKKLGFLK